MKGLNFLLHFKLLMKKRTLAMTVTLVVLGLGLVFASASHTWQVLAQTNTAKNVTQNAKNATATNATKAATGNSTTQSSNKGSATGTTSTPAQTASTVKGGPKAAGSASQLQQIEGNNTNILTNSTNVGTSPGLKGLSAEHNTTRSK
jgi:hypothetical protein